MIEIVKNNVSEVQEELELAIARALEAMGLFAESNVKAHTPVDTGTLRNSITHEVKSREVDIGTNVEYAPYVEYGHRTPSGGFVDARHFLRDGIMNNLETYARLAEQALKGF